MKNILLILLLSCLFSPRVESKSVLNVSLAPHSEVARHQKREQLDNRQSYMRSKIDKFVYGIEATYRKKLKSGHRILSCKVRSIIAKYYSENSMQNFVNEAMQFFVAGADELEKYYITSLDFHLIRKVPLLLTT